MSTERTELEQKIYRLCSEALAANVFKDNFYSIADTPQQVSIVFDFDTIQTAREAAGLILSADLPCETSMAIFESGTEIRKIGEPEQRVLVKFLVSENTAESISEDALKIRRSLHKLACDLRKTKPAIQNYM